MSDSAPARSAQPLTHLSLAALSRALAAGRCSSVEVTDAFLARAQAVQPTHRPYALLWPDAARAQAAEADARRARGLARSPLDGVPVSIKESLDVIGQPTTLGLPSRKHHVATNDAAVVAVLRDAGAVFLGKTNVSQALLFVESKNPIYGETTNPWNSARAPGGSSGGEAAAIALGASPGGVGTDVGGSIRVPCHFSAVAGLKPTNDRWSNLGCIGALAGQEVIRGQSGPMARSVEDLELLMAVVTPEKLAVLDPRVPPVPHVAGTSVDVKQLKVGVFVDDGVVTPSTAVQRATWRAADALRDAGVVVEPVTPLLVDDIVFTYLAAMSADGARTLKSQLDAKDVEPALAMLWRLTSLPAAARAALSRSLSLVGERQVARVMDTIGERRVDELWRLTKRARELAVLELQQWRRLGLAAVICPPHATPALPLGASREFTLGGALSMRFNLLNFPAGVVPVSRVRDDEATRVQPRGRMEKVAASVDEGSAGLPVGVQVVARPWHEHEALALMAVIEAAVQRDDDYPALPVA